MKCLAGGHTPRTFRERYGKAGPFRTTGSEADEKDALEGKERPSGEGRSLS
jgi:hypothetical protein